MARRANGEGTIRHRTDGAWEMSVSIAAHRYWLRGKTQAEVRAKLAELQRQYHIGTLAAPSRITLSEYLDQWLDAGQADWKPKRALGNS